MRFFLPGQKGLAGDIISLFAELRGTGQAASESMIIHVTRS